ncbi:MAG: hypothetical protein WBD12_02205, partial [Candidatus Omnitrophota bacterium]
SRCIEVIDEIVGLLNEYGSDKAVREALMPKLNQFISRYVTLANEIAGSNAPEEPDESAAYKNWRNLLPVTTEMARLKALNDWGVVASMYMFASYLDVMFKRESGKSREGLSFGYMWRTVNSDFTAITDKDAKDTGLEEAKSILSWSGKNQLGEYFSDYVMGRSSTEEAMKPVFMELAASRLKEDRDAAGILGWTRKYVNERFGEIERTEDADKKAEKIKAFADWMKGVENTRVRDAVIAAVEGIDNPEARAEVSMKLAGAENIPAEKRVELYIFAAENGKDIDTRQQAVSGLEEMISAKKIIVDTAVADQLIAMSDTVMGREGLTDSEAVSMFNFVHTLKVSGREQELAKKREEALERIKTLREESLRSRSEADFMAKMMLVADRRELARMYEQQGELEKAKGELEEANKILSGEMDTMISLQREGKLDEYGGAAGEVINASSDVMDQMEQVLAKMDKIDSDWYLSKAKGEVQIAKFFMAQGDLDRAAEHLNGTNEVKAARLQEELAKAVSKAEKDMERRERAITGAQTSKEAAENYAKERGVSDEMLADERSVADVIRSILATSDEAMTAGVARSFYDRDEREGLLGERDDAQRWYDAEDKMRELAGMSRSQRAMQNMLKADAASEREEKGASVDFVAMAAILAHQWWRNEGSPLDTDEARIDRFLKALAWLRYRMQSDLLARTEKSRDRAIARAGKNRNEIEQKISGLREVPEEGVGAFAYLEEAQRRNPKNSGIVPGFDAARLELSRLELRKQLEEDYVDLLRKREEEVASRDEYSEEISKIDERIAALKKEIESLKVSSLDDRRREQAQAATDEAQKKKREHDIEVYEAEAGISAKQEELALA